MKIKILIFLLLSAKSISQNWETIPKTAISYYIPTEKRIYLDHEFGYFKKGEALIIVDKFLSEDFLKVFASNPEAFDDICKAAYNTIGKSDLESEWSIGNFSYLKDITANISFKEAVVIHNREIVRGVNEFIWVLHNGSGYNLELGACYINMVFQKNKTKKKGNYLTTVKNHCEI